MKKIFLSLIILCLSGLFFQCENSIGPESPGKKLLVNSSFEIFGKPTLSGWMVKDTSIVSFTNDSPPDGGKWSLSLDATYFLPIYETPFQKIKLINGTKIYTFSFWAKSETIVKGIGVVNVYKADSLVSSKTIRVSDPVWTKYSISDTLSSDKADSLLVTEVTQREPIP